MKSTPPRRTCSTCPVVVVDEIREYIQWLERLRYSPRSIDTYRRALVDMDAFLAKAGVRRAEDITSAVLRDYRLSMVERGFKPSSQAVYIRAIRGLFGMLEQRRKIFINPAAGLVVRAQKRSLQRVPGEQEMRALLEAPDTTTPFGLRDRALLETAYATGARRAELACAALSGLDLPAQNLRLMGKGPKERVVPLTLSAVTWLGRYVRDGRGQFPAHESDALWLGKNGPLSPEGVAVVFQVHSKAAGLDPLIRPHAVRRACATHMLRNGAGLAEIQQLLGHASLRHLSQYLAVSITELRRAHERSELGS